MITVVIKCCYQAQWACQWATRLPRAVLWRVQASGEGAQEDRGWPRSQLSGQESVVGQQHPGAASPHESLTCGPAHCWHAAWARTSHNARCQDGESAWRQTAYQHWWRDAELAGRYQTCAGVSSRGDYQRRKQAQSPSLSDARHRWERYVI